MPTLFDSLIVNTLTLKNRVVLSPMCMYECKKEDGMLTPFHEAHYASRAIGQVGLILLEAAAITKQGRITKHDLGIWNDAQADKYRSLVTVLKDLGSSTGIQLAHAGRKAEDEPIAVAPSARPFSERYAVPKEMTLDEIQEVVHSFGQAAKRAEFAGFDVVEIHGAHGYLLNQFISPLTNYRIDAYGSASLETRYRIWKEVIHEVRHHFTGSVWMRISADEYSKDGTTREEFVTLVNWMQADGVEVVDVSTGGVVPVAPLHVYPGYQTSLAAYLKQQTGATIMTVGKLGDPALANYVIETNQSDLVALGRPLLRNPHWVYEAAKQLNQADFKPFNESYERGYVED